MKTDIPTSLTMRLPWRRIWPLRHITIMVGTTMLISACAGSPKAPYAELQAAEQAIGNAERAQTVRYTNIELNAARSELSAARNAVTAKNMSQAQRLAMQAQASAELALARAELIKAQAVNQDMQQSIDALEQEAQRNLSGVKP
ncbi:DUF4398 domain-containing protein [Bowmanella dokdonensis]|uniref:DUF4398 domain-containing protein n=1 Tax=Bowmanella dokdonensis TaxID=751969 RepID=A0A939DPH9_9ALTE|nr:DUF4398 domain-containing protein [Bowmanella dokdonensis]MBN7826402.1 DUF4398 domain-containing protein [Bowmanella dokdonensis]